ncbi:MAG: HlyD family efflux transporter periplasmic adaptor subunit [Gemmatimonadetes bacterium]|nr:HlyD family efflux transporter periplasmic adaptor subunit [Gemmatimonadota bacterium]NNK63923.1 HlyD family efflux transporter periplasmic adaptor subunit [Gemmatimonadota bacterium]
MDIIRDTKPKKRKRSLIIAAVIVGFAALTFAVQQLPSAAPSVDRAVVWMDTVEQGTLVRQIRGPGTLVPEQARLITAVTNGRVERIELLPGAVVEQGDVILRMSNPDVDLQLLQAQSQLSQAQSTLMQTRANLRTNRLQQEGAVKLLETQLSAARRTYETNQRLWDTNPALVARSELDRSREEMEQLQTRVDLERERLQVMLETEDDQIMALALQVERLQETVSFNQDRLASLVVTAPIAGTLSPLEIPLQEGQYVTSGQQIARIVVPGRLKAEIRISQTQAQEIIVGQTALIDTRTDTIEGQVSRIDPAVRQGSVTIDVSLPLDLPPSARPDLSVDGNVIIDRLDDVLHISRPSFAQANQRASLFRLTPDGEYAERVQVLFGASSVNDMEVLEGLRVGDVVLLQDMSQWDGYDRVRLR